MSPVQVQYNIAKVMPLYHLHPSQVLDSNSFEELASYPGLHAKSRLFRQTEGGVTDLGILPGGRLYSCGADGSVKCQTVVL